MPNGKLKTKIPPKVPISTREIVSMVGSPAIEEMKARAAAILIEIPRDKPFRPSTKFIAWHMPPETKTVKAIASGLNESAKSSGGKPVRTIHASNKRQATRALMKERKSLIRGVTFNPTSSPRPPKKTGSVDRHKNKEIFDISVSPLSVATKANAASPNPPMRGVGVLCEDCFAAEVCPFAVKLNCHAFVISTAPQHKAEIVNERATNAIMVNRNIRFDLVSDKKDSSIV